MQRKTKRIILAAGAFGVVCTAVGLGVGIVYFQNANYQNTQADPAQFYADLSAPSPSDQPSDGGDPGTEPAVDPQDETDVKTASGVLSVIRQTALSSSAFRAKAIAGDTWNAAAAASLGVTPPTLPEGVAVTFTKVADGDSLSFTIVKNKASTVVSARVTEFLGDDHLALDEAARKLSTLTVSSIPRRQFEDTDVPDGLYLPSAAQLLGLRYLSIDGGVSVRFSKPAGSQVLIFSLSKNQSTKSLSVPVDSFTEDDKILVSTVATALSTVVKTSAKQTDFFKMELAQTSFDAASAQRLGVSLPAIPSEVSVRVTKVGFSTTLTFAVSKNQALKVIAVPVTMFLGDNETYFEQTALLLASLKDSTLTEDAFKQILQPKATFTPAVAGALGINFLDELWGEEITVFKPLNTKILTFEVKKNGSTRTVEVEVEAYANNDKQDADQFAALLEGLTTSTLDQATFTGLAVDEQFSSTVASKLGVQYLEVPPGLFVKVSKTRGSATLAFAVSKGAATAQANPTVNVFQGGDKLDVEAAGRLLTVLKTSSLGRSAFLSLAKSGAPWNATLAAELGLAYTPLPGGVAASLTKSAQSATLIFLLAKNAASSTITIEVTTFSGDDKLTAQAAADALKAISSSSLTRAIFLASAYEPTNLSPTLAQNLGIALPALPSGVTIRLSKSTGSPVLSFEVKKGNETVSVSATITTFTGDIGLAITTAASALSAITTTSLTEQAFKSAAYSAVAFNAQQARLLGVTLPSLPAGLTVTLTKTSNNSSLNFALSMDGQSGTAVANVTRFTGDDLPAVQAAAAALFALTKSSLTVAAFTAAEVPQAQFTQALATTLGLAYPSGSLQPVDVALTKSAGSTTLVFTVSKGEARQTAQVVVADFAADTSTPVPGDKTITPAMRRAINYLSGFVDENLENPLPIRIFNYLRYNFVTLVGGASVDVWAMQNQYNVVISNALLVEYVRTLMKNVGLDIGNPGAYAFYQLLGPMRAILNELLQDEDIAALKLSITFEGNDTDQPLYVKAYIPVLPSDPTIVNTAKDAVRTTLPSKYYSYAGGPGDPPIRRELQDFIAQNPL